MSHRKILTIFLIMISLVLTTGTFAYWATNVEGTNDHAVSTLTIGSATGVITEFEINNEYSSGGYLVPANQLNNSLDKAVDVININHDIVWQEVSDLSQIDGVLVIGEVKVKHVVIIEQDGVILSQNKYSEVYNLVNVEYNKSNKTELVLNGSIETFNYSVTLTEPANQYQYNLISQSNIKIVFEYSILENSININNQENELITSGFEFIGDDVVYLELGYNFTDPGFKAYDSKGNEISNVWINNYPDTYTLGEYTITYGAYSELDNQRLTSKERTFIVIDTESPVINLIGNDTITHSLGVEYRDYYGAWASDNSYEHIEVVVSGIDSVDYNTPGTYTITYTATDSSGNVSHINRTIIIE